MKAILFHHVGGDHYAFNRVQQWLSPEIESFIYEMPGRANRIKEPLLHHLDMVLDDVLHQTRKWTQDPYFVLGMSLGGLIAFAWTLRLREMGLPLPAYLFMASRKRPGIFTSGAQISELPSGAFWEYVLKYGGCPPELPQHPELREFYEPILRADFSVAEDFIRSFDNPAPLDVHSGIYYGSLDNPEFAATDALDWAPFFRDTPDYQQFPGGHFFLYEDPAAIHHIKRKVLHGE